MTYRVRNANESPILLKISFYLVALPIAFVGCSGTDPANDKDPGSKPGGESIFDIETGTSAKILLEGFQPETNNPALEITMSERIIGNLARKYKNAFDESEIDQIKSGLREKLSCQVDRKNPNIATLQVNTGNRAFDVAILKGWILVLEDETKIEKQKAMAKVEKLKAEFKLVDQELDKEVEKLLRMRTDINDNANDVDGASTSDEFREAYKSIETKIEKMRVRHVEMAEKITKAKLLPKMDEFRKRVTLLTQIKPAQVTDKEKEYFQTRKMRCPELPEVKFSGTSSSSMSGDLNEPKQKVD